MTIVKRSLVFLFLCSIAAFAQQTRPERTNYEETSRYQDVMGFIDALKIDGTTMKQTWAGYSTQGKRLPMIVYGDVADTRPDTIRKSGKTGRLYPGEYSRRRSGGEGSNAGTAPRTQSGEAFRVAKKIGIVDRPHLQCGRK